MSGISYLAKEKTNKTLNEMDIHESAVFESNNGITLNVVKVAGGWIYNHFRLDCNSMTSVFVPYHNDVLDY